ncbi:MAG: VWA domain-containing protein [Ruminococcaceae bacterium]|nr:VWA domain-containing protein [Oscillospiraceae bacterium]
MSGDSKVLAAMTADGIAKQKLHVILIVDTSRSMQGERIGQVNTAIADIHKYLIDLQSENTNVDFYLSIMTFANRAEFLDGYKGVNVNDMMPPKLKAIGYSNLHCAYEELAPVLHKESNGGMMPDFGGIAPIVLLLTDGHPTKPTESQLKELKKLPWFRASLRYGIAIALDDERTMQVLTEFTDDKDCVIKCLDASTLAKIIQVIVLTASKVKSQSSAVRTNNTSKAQMMRGGKQASKQRAHIIVKQQVKVTLDEIDDWEW